MRQQSQRSKLVERAHFEGSRGRLRKERPQVFAKKRGTSKSRERKKGATLSILINRFGLPQRMLVQATSTRVPCHASIVPTNTRMCIFI
jgi:hypothetical protein